MNVSNPYESPSHKSESRSLSLMDVVVVGIWLAIPIGVFAGRQLALPVFEDFDVDLPTVTQYLLSLYGPILLTLASVAVLWARFFIPFRRMHVRFMWLACISGAVIGVVCLLSILGPLYSLWRDIV